MNAQQSTLPCNSGPWPWSLDCIYISDWKLSSIKKRLKLSKAFLSFPPHMRIEHIAHHGYCVAVWCSALQCVTVCCSVMQCIAVCASSVPAHKRVTSVTCKAESRQTGACKLRGLFCKKAILLRLRISLNKWTWLCTWRPFYMREGDPWPRCDVSAVWCVLQCVAVCCSVLQCVAVCCLMFLLSTKQKNVS